MGESWAYHIGHYLADQKYGSLSACAGEQFLCYYSGYITGLSSHLVALENYYPALSTYQFKWIPKGLYYDMIDTRNDITAIPRYVNLDDQVTSYTNQQFFNAFNSGITTMQTYRQNLLTQNGNNQSVQVTNLFQQYGY